MQPQLPYTVTMVPVVCDNMGVPVAVVPQQRFPQFAQVPGAGWQLPQFAQAPLALAQFQQLQQLQQIQRVQQLVQAQQIAQLVQVQQAQQAPQAQRLQPPLTHMWMPQAPVAPPPPMLVTSIPEERAVKSTETQAKDEETETSDEAENTEAEKAGAPQGDAGAQEIPEAKEEGVRAMLPILQNRAEKQRRPVFTEQDDRMLKAMIASRVKPIHMSDWHDIANQMGRFTVQQLRYRWHNYLKPGIDQSPFTVREMRKLAMVAFEHFGDWVLIAGRKVCGKNRSPAMLRDLLTALFKKLREGGIEINEITQLDYVPDEAMMVENLEIPVTPEIRAAFERAWGQRKVLGGCSV